MSKLFSLQIKRPVKYAKTNKWFQSGCARWLLRCKVVVMVAITVVVTVVVTVRDGYYGDCYGGCYGG